MHDEANVEANVVVDDRSAKEVLRLCDVLLRKLEALKAEHKGLGLSVIEDLMDTVIDLRIDTEGFLNDGR
jgi:hypothetical protein